MNIFWDVAQLCLVEISPRFPGVSHLTHRPDDGAYKHL